MTQWMTMPLPTRHESGNRLPTKAVLLAAGWGTRLRPLTDHCPKPMLPIGGRPLLEHTIGLLRQFGVAEVAVNLHSLPDTITGHFGGGDRFGVRMRYSFEETLRGTAGALLPFRGLLTETFYVLYGDVFMNVDLGRLARAHKERGALLTIGVHPVDDPALRGMVELAPDGRVRSFVEKPTWPVATNLANAGIYVAEPEILRWIPEQGASDFGIDIIPSLIQHPEAGSLYGKEIDGSLIDIGSPSAYQRASLEYEALALTAGGPRC